MEYVVLNIRGAVFKTTRAALHNVPVYSPLYNLNEDSEHFDEENGEYFFDRNAVIFPQILDYYRKGRLHLPNNICSEVIREELKFWGILESEVAKCCWKTFYQTDADMEILDSLIKKRKESEALEYYPKEGDEEAKLLCQKYKCVKSRVRVFVEGYPTTFTQKVWFGIIVVAILTSTALFMLSNVESLRVPDRMHKMNYADEDDFRRRSPKLLMFLNTSIDPYIIWCDAACNVILSVDWCIRFIVCVDLKEFLTHFLNITDATACISVWLVIFAEKYNEIYTEAPVAAMLAILYVTRIFRIFRLVRHNCGLHVLLLSLKNSLRELGILVMTFACCSIIFAVLVYLSELTSTSSFENVFISMWWAAITMTTVGYGDLIPTTTLGYVVGVMCSLFGILLIALPVAIISSNFYEFYNFSKYQERFIKTRDKEKRLLNNKSSSKTIINAYEC